MSAEFTIGDRVKITSLPPYFKTAEPMPMLRPSSVVAVGEEGIISDRRPGDYWCVKFTKGEFLVESKYLELSPQSPHTIEGEEKN